MGAYCIKTLNKKTMSYVSVAAAASSVLGIGINAAKVGKTQKKIDTALSKRKAFETPDEIFKILNATENKSQGDTIARDFQMNQLDTGFADALGTAELLGADPNNLSSLFGQKVQGILQVGDQYHKTNMEAFGNYMKALNLVADNKSAEQISQDNIWKDYMQSLSLQKSDQSKSIMNSINSLIGAGSAYATKKLYMNNDKTKTPSATGGVGGGFGYDTIGG